MEYSSDSAHWYRDDGTTCHEMPYADPKAKKYSDPKVLAEWHENKGKRATTIKDARKLGLYPSVSGILGQLDKPGLNRWAIEERLKVAHRMVRVPEYKTWRDSIESEFQEGNTSAEIGTRIHGSIEQFYQGRSTDPSLGDCERVMAVSELIEELFPDREWNTERSFASSLGYGGCCDLYSLGTDKVMNPDIVLDFKTKDDKWFAKKSLYGDNGNACQLAAYEKGLNLKGAVLVNIFVSRESDQVHHIIWPESEVYWKKFKLLLDLWKLEKNYYPGE